MILILTMAGKYTRFSEFSYEIPKYLLPVANRTLLHCVIKEFDTAGIFDEIILIANKRDKRFRSQIESTVNEFKFKNKSLHFIEDTPGQATTAYIGTEKINPVDLNTKPIVIHNIDTILLNREFSKLNSFFESNDCFIDVFSSRNNDYSYVLKSRGRITFISEKETISSMASSGCYGFKNGKMLQDYLKKSKCEYISDVINDMIQSNLTVDNLCVYSEMDTIVMGTPNEYISNAPIFSTLRGE